MNPAQIVTQLRAAGCVFAEEEAELLLAHAPEPADLAEKVRRRVAGEPLEAILGWVEFNGLRIGVAAGVFIPRRRTELLVDEGVRRLAGDHQDTRHRPCVLDLCCGVGAVGIAIADRVGVDLHACDIEPAAVHCARVNLMAFGHNPDQVYAGDFTAAIPDALHGRVDLIVANAPYVPTGEIAFMPIEARDYEPGVALDGGPDGVAVHRLIAAAAPRWLASGGSVIIETSRRQAAATAAALAALGEPHLVADDARDATAVVVQVP